MDFDEGTSVRWFISTSAELSLVAAACMELLWCVFVNCVCVKAELRKNHHTNN